MIPPPKLFNQVPQDNQEERIIPNKVGDTCNKIYRSIIQYWLSWDKNTMDKVEVIYSQVVIFQ